MIKRRSRVVDEADWQGYFDHIKSVCPWSYNAWRKGLIEITDYGRGIQPLGDLQARVYTVDLNPRRLKKLSEHLDQHDEIYEWLWSHPQGGGLNSTPLPCLIQQDRKYLNDIRNKINTQSNWSVQVGDTHSPKKEAL